MAHGYRPAHADWLSDVPHIVTLTGLDMSGRLIHRIVGNADGALGPAYGDAPSRFAREFWHRSNCATRFTVGAAEMATSARMRMMPLPSERSETRLL